MIQVLETSAKTGAGMEAWLEAWLAYLRRQRAGTAAV
jgi:hypothetical protein